MRSLLAFFLFIGAAHCDITLFNKCNETLQVMRKGQNLTELDPNRKFQITKPTSFEYFKIGDNGTTEAIVSKAFGRVSIEIDISLGFNVPMEIVYGNKRAVLSCLIPTCFGRDSRGNLITFKEKKASQHTGLFSSILDSFSITFCPRSSQIQ